MAVSAALPSSEISTPALIPHGARRWPIGCRCMRLARIKLPITAPNREEFIPIVRPLARFVGLVCRRRRLRKKACLTSWLNFWA